MLHLYITILKKTKQKNNFKMQFQYLYKLILYK